MWASSALSFKDSLPKKNASSWFNGLAPKRRDERDVPHKMEWVRHHDRYD
jgi:hypothetical protein